MTKGGISRFSVSSADYRMLPLVGEYVNSGKTVILPLRGYSMRPYLEDNRDKALLAPVPERLRVGDVVLAHLNQTGTYAMHRITATNGNTIIMCGDGNITPEVIERGDIIAIAKGFYRKGSTTLSSVEGRGYKLYWRIWLMLKPIRRYLLFAWRKIHGL